MGKETERAQLYSRKLHFHKWEQQQKENTVPFFAVLHHLINLDSLILQSYN